MTTMATTPFLNRHLRSETEYRAERELAAMLGNMGRPFSPRPTPADRAATRADMKRRRISRYARCLRAELDALELSGRRLHEEERMALVTLLTSIRRALA